MLRSGTPSTRSRLRRVRGAGRRVRRQQARPDHRWQMRWTQGPTCWRLSRWTALAWPTAPLEWCAISGAVRRAAAMARRPPRRREVGEGLKICSPHRPHQCCLWRLHHVLHQHHASNRPTTPTTQDAALASPSSRLCPPWSAASACCAAAWEC
uniref:Uncharacterized protein n=1 Tax=Arundo donax TaxID=35708 RepID=A0A0A9A868_ARUDO